MKSFIRRHAAKITGALSGLDRLRLRGTIRWLSNCPGMFVFLCSIGVLLKEFKDYAISTTETLRQRTLELADSAGCKVVYLESSSITKEKVARAIAEEKGIREGLIAVLSCVEPCWTFTVGPNPETKLLELRGGPKKCLHYYFYYLDPRFGFMHARLQTWFPFTIQVCINGREWLGRQLDAAGIGYQRRNNCFVEVADVATAQQLLDKQLQVKWPEVLGKLAQRINPVHTQLSRSQALTYYWSAEESEWATDIMFRSPQALAELFPRLVHHGMTTFGSEDVLRFLGQKLTSQGNMHGRFVGEVVTDVKKRPEGVRIKHRLNGNSIKMYDKQGSVLRVETTINDAHDMKAYRTKEGDSDGQKEWLPLRKGVADLHRRTELSQAANERYLEALAAVEETTPLGKLTEKLCRPVEWQGKRVRALHPFDPEEAAWLAAVARGEFTIQGFRNRDLRPFLFKDKPASEAEKRRQAAKVTRILRLLRAHGLIQKVNKTHRYLVTENGRRIIVAILAARQANAAELTDMAA